MEERETWSQVVRRPKKQRPAEPPKTPAREKLELLRRRAPKTAAVTIDRPPEGGSLAEVMKRVSRSINLPTLGVKVLTTRRTRAGGILLEIEGGEEKAATLAREVRALIGDGARVRQPESRTTVLLLDVPEWAAAEEVSEGLKKAGVDVSVGGDKPPIAVWQNSGGRGGFVARISLPFKDAIKLAEAKTVTIGWTRCRVKPIEKSQPSCYRCQERGHLAAECRNPAKPRLCHRCGSADHLLRSCRQPEKKRRTSQGGAADSAVQAVEQPVGSGGGVASELPPTDADVEGLVRRPATTSQPDRAP